MFHAVIGPYPAGLIVTIGKVNFITYFVHLTIQRGVMDDTIIYLSIGVMTFIIGLCAEYLITGRYYNNRFIIVAKEAENENSIAPLIRELERES